jgi:hypothetical protein
VQEDQIDAASADLSRAILVATALQAHLVDFERAQAEGDGTAVAGSSVCPAGDASVHGKVQADADADADALAEASAEATVGPDLNPSAPLPALTDAHLSALLAARRSRWQDGLDQARQAVRQQRRTEALQRQRTRQEGQGSVVVDAIAQAEAALDAGQLAEAHGHLSRIDRALQGGEAPEACRGRLAAVQARLAQLRGWQHWAGGRARDELVAQAEALAAATVADRQKEAQADAEAGPQTDPLPEPDGPDLDTPEVGTASFPEAVADAPASQDAKAPRVPRAPRRPAESPPVRAPQRPMAQVTRLSIRQRAEVIATLRERWQEIDRLGGAGGRALWVRFDTALKAAAEPLAAHATAQRAARATSLALRTELLEQLEAAGLAELQADGASPAEAQALAAALDRFRMEWRKLGPVEHTTPRAAQAALIERMEAAVRRADGPLQAARQRARADREALIARARTLAADGFGRERGGVAGVRDLQAEWQRQARSLSLARSDEQALWSQFKAAIDAGFAAREAAFSAREAEFEAHAAEREALIGRLRVDPELAPQAQRRLLAEVEAAWQRCGPAPRARAQALETAYRIAHQAFRQWLDNTAQREWQAVGEALDAKLALCATLEAATAAEPVDPEALAASWQALPALPGALEDALRQRAGLAPRSASPMPEVDEWLLQIEMAWELPTPPAFDAARRDRKLQALKQALENRPSDARPPMSPDAAMAHLLAQRGLQAPASDRLAAVLAAWRRRGPIGKR